MDCVTRISMLRSVLLDYIVRDIHSTNNGEENIGVTWLMATELIWKTNKIVSNSQNLTHRPSCPIVIWIDAINITYLNSAIQRAIFCGWRENLGFIFTNFVNIEL